LVCTSNLLNITALKMANKRALGTIAVNDKYLGAGLPLSEEVIRIAFQGRVKTT
jgi:hypothetical protein